MYSKHRKQINSFKVTWNKSILYHRGHQRVARGHKVARKDQVGRPRACSKINISMINVLTLTNINTKIIEGKLSKIFISEVCIELVALRINQYTRIARSCKKVGDPSCTKTGFRKLHTRNTVWINCYRFHRHVLRDGYRSFTFPGRGSPGGAQTFYPVVGMKEAGVWVLWKTT